MPNIIRLANGGVQRALTWDLMREFVLVAKIDRFNFPNRQATHIYCPSGVLKAYRALSERAMLPASQHEDSDLYDQIAIIRNDGIMPGVMSWWRGYEQIGLIVDLEARIHIQRIELHADDPDRLAFGLVEAFQKHDKRPTGAMARMTIPTPAGPIPIKIDATLGPGEIRFESTTDPAGKEGWTPNTCSHGNMLVEGALLPKCCVPLIGGLTPEQCRERWLINRSEQEIPSGAKRPVYDLTPAQIEAGKRYRTIQDWFMESLDAARLCALVRTSDAERKAREPSVVVDPEDE